MDKPSNQRDSLRDNVHPDNQNTNPKSSTVSNSLSTDIENLHKRIVILESLYRSEFKKVSESFTEFSETLNSLKSQLPVYVDNRLKLESNRLREKLNEAVQQLQSLAPDQDNNNALKLEFNAEIEQIRNDLIEGVRLLGKRVTRAIDTMDKRFDEFKDELKVDRSDGDSNDDKPDKFADLKETSLLDDSNYELIPKKSIEKLYHLFQKQSQNIRRFNDKQILKINDYERLMKFREEEYNKKINRLQDEMRTQTVVNIVMIIFLVVLFTVLHFVL